MVHVIEPAPSGRAKCRGCAQAIARDTLRFGERVSNPFADGEMTLWFHPLCAAYKRPEPFLQALEETAASLPDRQPLEETARRSLAHRRLPRIDGADQAPKGTAKCRHCRQPIDRGQWRIRLVFYEEGMFTRGGFVHVGCGKPYFETGDIRDQVLHFTENLDDSARAELTRLCDSEVLHIGPL